MEHVLHLMMFFIIKVIIPGQSVTLMMFFIVKVTDGHFFWGIKGILTMFFIVKVVYGENLVLLAMKNIVKVADPFSAERASSPAPCPLGILLQPREKPLLAVRLSLVFVRL
ncbi:hypothetical protein [Paenibacillus eucommiae]|uniref:Uncharacterized protein n=1 Tax=Paenibacillus eucommiae TaxID=1355755 RepID=A0ABS4J4E9_9BACL|nr:hypothetical protein [Paenibacillus eucommiae]MBP1993674.1 hypothetical protein [Paenibacillus eucommiae]